MVAVAVRAPGVLEISDAPGAGLRVATAALLRVGRAGIRGSNIHILDRSAFDRVETEPHRTVEVRLDFTA